MTQIHLPVKALCISKSIKSSLIKRFEPRHLIFNNVVYATSKASDQPVHMRSLISAFASRFNIL